MHYMFSPSRCVMCNDLAWDEPRSYNDLCGLLCSDCIWALDSSLDTVILYLKINNNIKVLNHPEHPLGFFDYELVEYF